MVATPVGHSPSQKSKIFASPLKEGAKTRDALSHRRCDTFTKINYNLIYRRDMQIRNISQSIFVKMLYFDGIATLQQVFHVV